MAMNMWREEEESVMCIFADFSCLVHIYGNHLEQDVAGQQVDSG